MTIPPLPAATEISGQLLEVMRASGRPRGLRWEAIDAAPQAEGVSARFALEHASGQAIALILVTIRFSALAGGDMEEVEAVPEMRMGTALLRFEGGEWRPTGRILFNLTPTEARERLGDLLRE